MSLLAKENIKFPTGIAKKLDDEEISTLLSQLSGWRIILPEGVPRLEKRFDFKNFSAALAFTDQVGALAEKVDHHPTILTEWGACTVTWWTHSQRGLLRNDFIMAAKTDQLYEEIC